MKQAFSVSHLGDLLRAPAVAGFVMFGVALGTFGVASQPAQAQLPPVNMGKFVHQPGDNQYSNGTQGERHGTYQVVNPSAQQTQGPSGWVPTHKSKPDISLEPIVCDEPIAKAGFPPIPDSLELPGLRGGGSFTNYGGAGGGGGGGGTAPGLGPAPPSKHQGYDTYQPGAFGGGHKTGHGAEMYASGDGSARPSGGGGRPAAPNFSQTQNQLNHMGKEPTLSARANTDAAPEAPQAVQVNQATTQDLSLPDDQNANSGKKKSNNQAGRGLKRMENQVLQKVNSGVMQGMGALRMPSMK